MSTLRNRLRRAERETRPGFTLCYGGPTLASAHIQAHVS